MKPQEKSNKSILIPSAIAIVVILVIVSFYLVKSNGQAVTQNPVTQMPTSAPTAVATSAKFKDGTYTSDGNYVSPGGPRDIGLTLTIKDDIIIDSTFEVRATDPTSKKFQTEFAENYKALIMGKKIDTIALTKVSGSSLTPAGFSDALGKIKEEASI